MWYATKIFFDFRRQDNAYMYLKKNIFSTIICSLDTFILFDLLHLNCSHVIYNLDQLRSFYILNLKS